VNSHTSSHYYRIEQTNNHTTILMCYSYIEDDKNNVYKVIRIFFVVVQTARFFCYLVTIM